MAFGSPAIRRPSLPGRLAGTLLLPLLLVPALQADPASAQEEGQEGSASQIQRETPLSRVGLSERFSAIRDSAPSAVDWSLMRQEVAVRYEPSKNEDLSPGTRKNLVLHAALIEGGTVQRHVTSDPVDLLPGATKFDPDVLLPEESMIPDGYRVGDPMSFGEIKVPPGEIMSDLVRDIVADMTKDAPALYLAATPPEGETDGPRTIFPVLVRFVPTGGGGGAP